MATVFESITQAITQTLAFVQLAFQEASPNPNTWSLAIWLLLLAAIVLVFLIARAFLPKPKLGNSDPELLVSRGIVQQPESSPTQILTLKVSNLNDYPVQLLEMSLQSELMSLPFMVEAAEIIGPHAAIELQAVLPNNIVGDSGVLEIYTYLSKRQNKIYKLSTRFEWEPWAQRYKIEPMGQKLRKVRMLASTKLNQSRKKAWHQYAMKTHAPKLEEDVREDDTKPSYDAPPQERKPIPKAPQRGDMEFPADF